mgnify:FL=1
MIIRFGMAPRLRELSPEAALEHWRTSHADAAGAIPGLRSYIQFHPVLEDGHPLLPYPGFDACSMLDFDSVEAMDEGFASETYRSSVRADEDRFIEKARFASMLGVRETLVPAAAGADVLTVCFMRRHASCDEGRFRAEVMAAAAAVPGRDGHDLALAVEVEGRANTFDAVELRRFATPAAALAWVLDPAGGGAARRELAGVVGTTEWLVARPFTVC